MNIKIFQITPKNLTSNDIRNILENNTQFELSEESVRRIEKSKRYLDKKLEESDKPLLVLIPALGHFAILKFRKLN